MQTIMKYITVVMIAVLSFVIALPLSQTHAQAQVATPAVSVSKHLSTSPVSKTSSKPASVVAPQKQAQQAPVVVSKPAEAPTPAQTVTSPTPAPQPVHAAPTQAAQPASGCNQYRSLFAQYSWNVTTAVAICQAESGGNASAVSNASINFDHVSDYGLMQLHGVVILDPAANVAYAYYHKYLTQGWGAWSTYTSGIYAKFL